ncbi:MAG: alpha-L-rhamnosidase C-terminal domain-containing protein, partial [Lentisphaeria bacterium]
EHAVKALQRVCFKAERGVFVDGEGSDHASLHANIFPAAFGLIPPGSETSVHDFIRSRGMACSVYGAQYLLEACFRLKNPDYALDLMTADHDRSWLNMLRIGSTITLEAWDWRYKNNLDWNHAWGAAPANIIPRFIAGVRPAEPGFGKVLIAPQSGRLNYFASRVPTPYGTVKVTLEEPVNGRRRLNFETPVAAKIDLSGLGKTASESNSVEDWSPGSHEVELQL